MKKLVFMFVAVAAISFASCGNQTQAPAPEADTIVEVIDSVDSVVNDTVDSTAIDTVTVK